MKRCIVLLLCLLTLYTMMAQDNRYGLSGYYFGRNNDAQVCDDTLFVACNKGVFAYPLKVKAGENGHWLIYGFNDMEIIHFAKSGRKMLAVRRTFQNVPGMYSPMQKQTLLLSDDWGHTFVDITPEDMQDDLFLRDMTIRQMPDNPDHLYLAYPFSNGYYAQMLETTDFGQSWKATAKRNPYAGAFAVDPSNSNHILVYGLDPYVDCICPYIQETMDNFQTLNDIPFSTEDLDVDSNFEFSSIAISPSDSRLLVAATSYGLAKSSDGGLTWRHTLSEKKKSYSGFGFVGVVFDENHPQTLYACNNRPYDQNKDYVLIDVFRSEDAGENWELMDTSLALSAPVNKMVLHDGKLFCIAAKEEIISWNLASFPTSINSTLLRKKTDNPACYDLQGRRYPMKPQNGIYIQNGRKVIN